MDRNQLEQEAMQQLNRGNAEGALKAYSTILRSDPKDRRIRQKVGELMLKLGRTAEAERQLREVAESLVREGAHRAAVAVLKQVLALRPDDPLLQMDLGDCYVASGYPNDARQHYDAAMRLWIGASKAALAAGAARKLSELSPGEPALRLKVAELHEAAGDTAGAGKVYQEVCEEYRRRGRPDEVGRVAEMALRLKPDDLGLLLDAAAARVEAQDWKKALGHLQPAFQAAPREARVLDLLARSFEGLGQVDKALKVLLELARLAEDRADPAGEADALRRAVKHLGDDASVKERLAAAEAKVSRLERRLGALALWQPVSEAELAPQVRAEVYARYGFFDRAEATLRAGLEARPDSLALLAALGEVAASRGATEEAVRWMERIVPRAGDEVGAVLDRIAVLRGGAAPQPPAAPPSPEPVAAPSLPPVDETAEQRGDRLAAAGDIAGAVLAYREALQADPLDDGVLVKIAALRPRARDSVPPPPPPAPEPDPFADLSDGTFAEVSPDHLDELAEPDLEEARSLVAVGMYADALAMVEGVGSLPAQVIYAQALKGLGDVARAVDVLREATNDAGETDDGYLDALFELSGLYTATGKHRAALRLLEEVQDLDAGYRTSEVEARMRGLQKLASR